MNPPKNSVIIVGAGLAGLACALQLHASGVAVTILEGSDDVGGRVRTDVVDGFLLDRGFQVLLTSYPEAKRVLHFPALELSTFFPGALVHFGGRFELMADPYRSPRSALGTLASRIGTLGDKVKVGALRRRMLASSIPEIFKRPHTSTLRALQRRGFSQAMIDRFFRPFFGGIFLERDLETSSRMFEFAFKMFAEGQAALPAKGMQEIPRQIAQRLPEGAIRTGARVESIHAHGVSLATGERLTAQAVVIATDGMEAGQLIGQLVSGAARPVTTLYYAAFQSPIKAPILVLNGDGNGPINHLCVPSLVNKAYAPPGQVLISASVLGNRYPNDALLERAARAQLTSWFGQDVWGWRHLRTYRIPYALPSQAPSALEPARKAVRLRPGLYVCGDYRENASIEGALSSGRRAAISVLEELQGEEVEAA